MKITKKRIWPFILVSLAVMCQIIFVFPASPASADQALWDKQVGTADVSQAFGQNGQPLDVRDMIVRVITYFLGFVALICIIIIIWGGVTWMTSAGEERRVSEAKARIRAAIIGLIVIMSSYAITQFIVYATQKYVGNRW